MKFTAIRYIYNYILLCRSKKYRVSRSYRYHIIEMLYSIKFKWPRQMTFDLRQFFNRGIPCEPPVFCDRTCVFALCLTKKNQPRRSPLKLSATFRLPRSLRIAQRPLRTCGVAELADRKPAAGNSHSGSQLGHLRTCGVTELADWQPAIPTRTLAELADRQPAAKKG